MSRDSTSHESQSHTEIRNEMTGRIVKNLHQVQEYLQQLEEQLHDPAYESVVVHRAEWARRNQDLRQKLTALQTLFDAYANELQGDDA
jgi:hypothetical protein